MKHDIGYVSLNPRLWILALATFSRKRKKCSPRVGNKFQEMQRMFPGGFFMIRH
jgi:hypothetical protein